MKITTRKEGGKWHGYVEGHSEIDEVGLTEEVARRKAETVAARIESGSQIGHQSIRSGRRRA